MGSEIYEIFREESVRRRIESYADDIAGTPKLVEFLRDTTRLRIELQFKPLQWGELKYRRIGENGLIGFVLAGGMAHFWVRYVVYRQISTVLIVDFGGRV